MRSKSAMVKPNSASTSSWGMGLLCLSHSRASGYSLFFFGSYLFIFKWRIGQYEG